MSSGPEIALNRGPLVTCLCQRVGEDIKVWRSGCRLDPIERHRIAKNIDVPLSCAAARRGQEEHQMLCAVGRRLYPRYLIDLAEICRQGSGSTPRNNEQR